MTPVTIGMPAFDSARTLARAIASVQAQTHSDWRLIISDDASTDASPDIAADAARADARITLVRQPTRLGVMNFGVPLAAADTPVFVWLAADDWWEPGFLSATLAALATRPDAVSALPRAAWAEGTPLDGPPSGRLPDTTALDMPWPDRVRRFLAHPGGTRMYGLIRTTAAQAAFPPRAINAWDWALMLGLLAQGPQIEVPETLLLREETHWQRYAEGVDEGPARGLNRTLPVLEASLLALRRGHVPRGAWGALVALNLRKHEEYIAICHPQAYGRRLWLYRRLGLPFACRPGVAAGVMTTVAARNATRNPARAAAARDVLARLSPPARTLPAAPPRSRNLTPPLTVVVTARNAASTLDRFLDHYRRHDATVILIDHGSTDRTRAIALAHPGAPVAQIIDQPFEGSFDLTAQLNLKRQVIGTIRDGWVIHADADEMLDPPPDALAAGQTLRALAAGWTAATLAAPCRELAFLPLSEDDSHDPATFPATMRHALPIADRDPKQRLFRAGADLTLWCATAGHTVTTDPTRLAPATLVLRHYPGLSLDHLRAQYLGRVFAHGDRAKRWHGTRSAAEAFDIVAPPIGALAPLGAPEAPAQRSLPVLAPRPPEAAPRPDGPVDLWLVAARDATAAPVHDLIARAFPGLRMQVSPVPPVPPAAMLHILTHPATACALPHAAARRAAACDWLRGIARARQSGLSPGLRIAEVRVEDMPGGTDDLMRAVQQLLLPGSAPVEAPPFLRDPVPVPLPCPAPEVAAITGDMARDLGYAWAATVAAIPGTVAPEPA